MSKELVRAMLSSVISAQKLINRCIEAVNKSKNVQDMTRHKMTESALYLGLNNQTMILEEFIKKLTDEQVGEYLGDIPESDWKLHTDFMEGLVRFSKEYGLIKDKDE